MNRLHLCVFLLTLLLLTACVQAPLARPREGASPSDGGAPSRLQSGPPPTLVGASVLSQTVTPTPEPRPAASPSPQAAASPGASPGAYPVISGLQPAPGTTLPAGDIVIGARVSASSDLADVVIYIDNEPVLIDMSGPPARTKAVSMVRGFTLGLHELRIQARDDRGLVGGYRWQFTVGTPRQSAPLTVPKPAVEEPTATPFPIPTRRPTSTPIPKPALQTPGPAPKPVIQPNVPTTVPVLIPAVRPSNTPVR